MSKKPTNLEQLLQQISKAESNHGYVTLGMIVEAVGSRSFGPLLLLVGVLLTSPLSGIPGMPTTMAALLLLIALQLLFGRKHFWLPQKILKQSVKRKKLNKVIQWFKPSARFIDRWLQPRLTVLVDRFGTYTVAIICLVIAACLPVMELVLFSATGAGIIITAFGLSLVANDGLLALLAFTLTAIIFGLVIYNFL
jgi:hypothetical protein